MFDENDAEQDVFYIERRYGITNQCSWIHFPLPCTPLIAMSRPFVHIAGSKAALQMATTAAKAFGIALGVGGVFQMFVFNQQKKEISNYYNK